MKKGKSKSKSFNEICELLNKYFPAKKPVIVKRCKTPYDNSHSKCRLFGITYFNDDNFLIKINKDHPIFIQRDTLIHEWAHCITPYNDKHSNRWGIAYASIYRKIQEP